MKSLKLAWLFPSTLYLHGERGNILAFERVAKMLDQDLKVDYIGLDDEFNPLDYDIIYCSAGETVRASSVVDRLSNVNSELNEFIDQGKPFIVTGNSVGFFGNVIHRKDNDVQGLSIIDIEATENPAVYGDDILFKVKYNNKDLDIIGQQIQMNDLENISAQTFGDLIYGYGNSKDSLNEGFIRKNSIFTNTLGPMFALNPWLTKEVIKVALDNKNIDYLDKELDFTLEEKSRLSKVEYIKNKKTNLKKFNH